MRIAIASESKDENSAVSEMSGRAPYYLIFEDEKPIKSLKNPFAVGGGGAGFGVAEMLGDEGVDIVISGKFGNNMIASLKSKNIKYKEISGISVKEALKEALRKADEG